jgi:hypothetical protein
MAVTPVVTDAIPPIEIGNIWIQQFNYAPGGVTANISAWTARYDIKSSDRTGATTILSLTTSGGVSLGSTNPNITVTATAVQTTGLSEARGYAFLTLIDGSGNETLYIKGPQIIEYAGS